jgi:non-ribosomal peptide synthetase component F/acyl carrier protein
MTLSARDKRALLARLMAASATAGEDLPLSYGQEALWFLDQLEPGSAAYNVSVTVRLGGSGGPGPVEPDVATLQRCVDVVVARHSVLRSVFAIVDGRPARRAITSMSVPVRVVDVSVDGLARAREVVSEEAASPFDLTVGPLVRVRVVRLGAHECWVVVTVHHIVADGWSMDVLFGELEALYRAYMAGEDPRLPLPQVQYGDWVRWQREWLTPQRLAGLVAWWRERLAGMAAVLDLPADRPRPAVQSHRGARHRTQVPAALIRRLDMLGAAESATRFVIILTAFCTVLHRWSGQERFVVGVPVANRSRPEIMDTIGYFVNTLPLPVQVLRGDTVATLLRRLRELTIGALAHQDLPFDKLVEAVAPERSLAYNPLVQVMFTLQNTQRRRFGGDDRPPIEPPASGRAKLDLSLNVVEHSRGVDLAWEYAMDLFDHDTVVRIDEHLTAVLEACCADSAGALHDIELAPAARPDADVVEVPIDTMPAFPALVASHAARCPWLAAVEMPDGRTLAYDELGTDPGHLETSLGSLGLVVGGIPGLRAVAQAATRWGLRPGDRVLHLAPANLHVPGDLVAAVLLAGATLVAARRGDHAPNTLGALVRQREATVLSLSAADLYHVESAWTANPDEVRGHRLHTVVVDGPELSTEDIRRWWLLPVEGVRLLLSYRPVVDAVCLALREITRDLDTSGPPRRLALGAPVAGWTLDMLGRSGRPAHDGLPGELCVGGEGLELRHLGCGQPDAAEHDPHQRTGSTPYRTGHLARRRPDGGIEVIGRAEMVELRGFRLDLGRVETTLLRHPRVGEAAARVLPDADGTPRLAAYAVTRGPAPPSRDELRDLVHRSLPPYLSPAVVVLDRSATVHGPVPWPELPSPWDAPAAGPAVTPVRERVARILAEVLGVPEVRPHDNIFELGAQSLTAVRAAARLREAFKMALPLRALFESPTAAGLARHLGEAVTAGSDPQSTP